LQLTNRVGEPPVSAARRGRGMAAMTEIAITLHEEDIEMIAAYLARKP